jgi:predicted DCC family thiol-disulfide oxidoreductase YuxK
VDRDAPDAAEARGLGRPYTVVYDGACKVCKRIVAALTKLDTKQLLEIVPSQAPGVRARFPWIPDRAYAESVQLIGPGGETWQGARAVEEIISVLPRVGWTALLFRIPFVRPLAERFYRWFARNRYRLGCGEHCQYRELKLDYGEEGN